MKHQEVEVLAIGAGPANLALAVALEELAPELASRTLIVEQHDTVVWQRGMLLPWSQSQVSFLKDLVTLRNPRSQFSFVNYLHSIGRLNEFINMGSFTPYRLEISDYLPGWRERCARCGSSPAGAASRRAGRDPRRRRSTRWLVRLADGATDRLPQPGDRRGRDPHIPAVFDAPCRPGGSSTAPSTGSGSPRWTRTARTGSW